MRTCRVVAVGVVLLSALAACGSDAPLTAAGPSPVAARMDAVVFAFGADLAALTRVGATAQIAAIGVFSDQTTQNVTSSCVNWQSDDTRVLTVSGGLLTAQSNGGSATITTTCQTIAARGVVTVNPIPPPPVRPPSTTNPNAPPAASACPAPPYAFDPPPTQAICRGRDGRFATTSCCGARP